MPFIVGAYASAPSEGADDYVARLAELPGFGGLEISYTDSELDAAALSGLHSSWDVVPTTIAATVARNKLDPEFGLASTSAAGRRAALDMVRGLSQYVRAIDDRAGRAAVIGVELHSAPTSRGNRDALAASLAEIAQWEWDDALLTVEHCDSRAADLPVQKGYLTLADEVQAVQQAGANVAVTINWGRSAIDGARPATAVAHVEQAREAGVLGGVMFSGVSEVATPYGPAWADAHLPPYADGDPRFRNATATEPASLLGPQEITDTLRAAGGAQHFTGLKIGARPAARAFEHVRDALQMLHTLAPAALADSRQ